MPLTSTMAEPARSFAATCVEFDGVVLGSGTALIDDDILRVLLLDPSAERKSLQVSYDSIAAVTIAGDTVDISCTDGRALRVSSAEADAFRQRLLAACRALPEVTRALRALGSRRGAGGRRRDPTNDEALFFAPLIRARRHSMHARSSAGVIGAFDPLGLESELARAMVDLADRRSAGHPARRRAFESEIIDSAEELTRSLADLADLAANAAMDVDDLGRWRKWASGVQRVFEAADRSWLAIEQIVSR
jgi:hypothetical protein